MQPTMKEDAFVYEYTAAFVAAVSLNDVYPPFYRIGRRNHAGRDFDAVERNVPIIASRPLTSHRRPP